MGQDGPVGILIALIALLLAAACCAATLWLRAENLRLHGEVSALHAALDGLGADDDTEPALPPGVALDAEQLITVEILNPLELATAQSRAATVLHRVRPQLLSRIVYEQAARELEERLGEEGVVAEVRVHGGR
jgi:hypothetical protein